MDSNHSEQKNIYIVFTLLIQAAVALGLIAFVLRRDWENTFLTMLVLGLTLIPSFLFRQYRVYIPPEFQLIAAGFVFLSLFLGSAADFYYRFWWWDIVLHTGSGFLLGIIGFLAVFLLNQTDRIPVGISPAFVCFFSVTFAVFLGVIWEIFEFAVDMVVPSANMLSWETGAGDTIVDLIVDTVGAVVVALMGWAYIKTGRYSFIADGVRLFIRKNPRFFPKNDSTTKES
jgi:hypothetical protein